MDRPKTWRKIARYQRKKKGYRLWWLLLPGWQHRMGSHMRR